MGRPRKKYHIYPRTRVRPQDDLPVFPDNQERLPKLLGVIRKTIKSWLDSTPAFSAAYFTKYLIVRDAINDSQLAVVEFKEDHLTVHVPQPDDPRVLLAVELELEMPLDGHKILYSDPGLHTRVKFVVNQAYQEQGR